MKISAPGQARANFYDRNPTSINQSYDVVGVAPAGLTNRWVYTVPANRKALIGVLLVHQIRDVVATTPLQTTARIQMVSGTLALLRTYHSDNTLWVSRDQVAASGTTMNATETLTAQTSDASTGGSNQFTLSLLGTEFDA